MARRNRCPGCDTEILPTATHCIRCGVEGLWFYISFADADLPTGQQFLGGAYVRGATIEAAIRRTHALGINPGGSASCVGPILGKVLEREVPKDERERLLTRAEVEAR